MECKRAHVSSGDKIRRKNRSGLKKRQVENWCARVNAYFNRMTMLPTGRFVQTGWGGRKAAAQRGKEVHNNGNRVRVPVRFRIGSRHREGS